MSTKAAVSIDDYLRTSFEGLDREYVDGEIVERTLPDDLHSKTQWRLSGLIWDLSKKLPFYGRTELRSRVAVTRVRIPDVSIYAGQEPAERVPANPPLVAIEILSHDDRYSEVMQELTEYETWGVRHIWLVDPPNAGRCMSIWVGVRPKFQRWRSPNTTFNSAQPKSLDKHAPAQP